MCPFCRSFNPKRLSVRLLKYLSPVIAVLGLFVLHYIGIHYGNPEVKLDTLTKRSNFAQVSIKASVSSPIKYYAATGRGEDAGGSLEFEIDDGTALMLVRCYDDATRELVESKKVPGYGDSVKLRASFQYKGKGGFLILGSERGIEVNRNIPASATPIKAIIENAEDKFKKGGYVKISGKIAEIDNAKYELVITLNCGSDENQIKALLPLSVLQINKLVKENPEEWKECPAVGDFVTIYGALDKRGRKDDSYLALILPSIESIVKTNEEQVKKDNLM